jgi:hypothetical protein
MHHGHVGFQTLDLVIFLSTNFSAATLFSAATFFAADFSAEVFSVAAFFAGSLLYCSLFSCYSVGFSSIFLSLNYLSSYQNRQVEIIPSLLQVDFFPLRQPFCPHQYRPHSYHNYFPQILESDQTTCTRANT